MSTLSCPLKQPVDGMKVRIDGAPSSIRSVRIRVVVPGMCPEGTLPSTSPQTTHDSQLH